NLYLEKEDPLAKAQRASEKAKKPVMKKPDAKLQFPGTVTRKPIPAGVKHAVILRDGGQCRAVLPGGKRCPSKRWLDVHHVQFKSRGGPDTQENLQLLCSSHHHALHGR